MKVTKHFFSSSSVVIIILYAFFSPSLIKAQTYDAPLDTRIENSKVAPIKFKSKPVLIKEGVNYKISFELSGATDVEISIINEQGKSLRHLAAGLLGKNAPEPFKKDSLSQVIIWDGNSDKGVPVTEPCQVKVSIGSQAKIEKIVGWDGNNISGIVSIAVGKDGELFVLTSETYRGGTDLYVLDKQGKYLRTIIPYPANTPAENLLTVGQITLEKEKLPVVLNAVSRTTYPLINGVRNQTMAFSPLGHLILTSGVGTLSEQGPPRHLLALHPAGGAPKGINFVGPQIRKASGFIGGSGEGGVALFDYLAVDSSGENIYFTVGPYSRMSKKGHGVIRTKWSEKEIGDFFIGKPESGKDNDHFDSPEGIAVDNKGNIYVCDWGNNRVMIFSSEAKFIGMIPVEMPEQICINSKNGEIYVFSCDHKKAWARYWESKGVIRKFAFLGSDTPKELYQIAVNDINLMALDSNASPAKLWIAGSSLVPVVDDGAKFNLGINVINREGLQCPWFVSGDSNKQTALVYERNTMASTPTIFKLDLNSGKKTKFCEGTNLTVDADGNAYILGGRDSTIYRYDSDGKPLPFSGTGTHKILTKGYRGFGPNLGIPGIAVSPAGNIYVMRTSNYGKSDSYGGRVDVYGPDGKLIKENIVNGLGYGDCGLGVDAAENIYVGSNLKTIDKPFPDEFMGKVPVENWKWWKDSKREPPWCYPHLNTYLFYWGSVFKFGSSGGIFYGQHPWLARSAEYGPLKPSDSLANAPADASTFRSAYLGFDVKVAGAKWRYHGMGVLPSSGDGLAPDPGCICHNSRVAVDEYGRVFIPDVFKFSVEMLDTNGNQIARIGRYGNADSAGIGSKIPEPEIAFAWPCFVSINQGKLMVSDPVNRRITLIKFEYQTFETIKISK